MKIFMGLLLSMVIGISLQADWKVAGNALKASDEFSGDWFGYSVDISENYAIIGAPHESMGGAIYIFKRDSNGDWVEMQKIDATDATIVASSQFNSSDVVALSSFGSDVAIGEAVSTSVNPSMLVIGASNTSVYHNDTNVYTGAFCTYELNITTDIWQQQEKCVMGLVSNTNGSSASGFGTSVDISNWKDGLNSYAKIINGDPYYDGQKYTNIGLIAFYSYSSSNWNLVNLALGSGGAAASSNVYFGKSVAIHKNTAVVGATGYNIYDPNDDDPDSVMVIHEVGAAHFFTSSGTLINTYTPAHEETEGKHNFGMSVDIYGDYSIVSEKHREGGTTSPAAYIMKRGVDGNWTQHNYIENSTVGYGTSVAINDTHAAVGALNAPAVGAAYMYKKDSNGDWNTYEPFYWLDNAKRTASGIDVALYENNLMVGAPLVEEVKQFEYIPDNSMSTSVLMYLLN